MKKLVIIGNGFDINEKIPSKYKNFYEYLLKTDFDLSTFTKIYSGLNPIYQDEESLWNYFEQELSNYNPNYHGELISKVTDNTSGITGLSIQIQEFYSNLISDLQKHFNNWSVTLNTYNKNQKYSEKTINDYITFNYTNTLEVRYGVSRSRINYLHGKVNNVKTKLIFGHGDENAEKHRVSLKDYIWYDDHAEYGQYANLILDIIAQGKKLYKDTALIASNSKLFNQISSNFYDEIYIIGLSLDIIDDYYFSKIISSQNKNTTYFFSKFVPENKKAGSALHISQFVKRHKIDMNKYVVMEMNYLLLKLFKEYK